MHLKESGELPHAEGGLIQFSEEFRVVQRSLSFELSTWLYETLHIK
jgi:hypothetical protein